MNASQSYSQSVVSLFGSEPYPVTTFSLDLAAGAGVLKPGTFISRAGAVAVTAAGVHGILAHETDATLATSATIYLTGSFLRDTVIAANSGATIDSTFEDTLRTKGLYLERSVGS